MVKSVANPYGDNKISRVTVSSINHVAWYQYKKLRPERNSRQVADIFKSIFLNENIWISLKLFPRGQITIILALVQIMAWRRPGDKSLSEPMMICFTDTIMRHSASGSWWLSLGWIMVWFSNDRTTTNCRASVTKIPFSKTTYQSIVKKFLPEFCAWNNRSGLLGNIQWILTFITIKQNFQSLVFLTI